MHDLDDWISDVGAEVLDRFHGKALAMSPVERLVYEVWVLDTETRNGGLSQYFGNRGIEQWNWLRDAVRAAGLMSFEPFAARVLALIEGSEDPPRTIFEAGDDAEDLWYGYQRAVVAEVREHVKGAL